jgi:protein-tyrosine phosphatase
MKLGATVSLFGLGLFVAAIAGCSNEPPVEVGQAQIVRGAAGSYELSWTTNQNAAPVDVYVATSPMAKANERRQLVDDNIVGKVSVSKDKVAPNKRPYFWVKAENGTTRMIAERVLPLEGGRNFRDLGGYETASGATVKWGVLYRSGVMSGLSAQDYIYLKQLGISQICDFRASEEIADEPTDWKAIGAVEYKSIAYENAGGDGLRAVFMKPDLKSEDVRQAMIGLYGTMVDRFVPHYSDMFARLVEGKAPLAFNCSAGKDRTGIAAALILSALGVPRETVLADYALSDKVVDYEAAYKTAPANLKPKDGPYAFLAALPAQIRAPLLKSDPAYLEAALNDIDTKYGSVEVYLDQKLGVSAQDLAKLKALYLQADQ